jgi:hypothetical protein
MMSVTERDDMAASETAKVKVLGGVPAAPTKRSTAIESGMRRLDEQLREIRRASDRTVRRRVSRTA